MKLREQQPDYTQQTILYTCFHKALSEKLFNL